MIELKNVTVAFGKTTVLNNLSCNINAGDFVTLVGANGSGKSTLFDVIAGKIAPSSGQIFFDKIEVTHLNELQRAPFVGRLFQNTHMSSVSSMTVEQNLALAATKGRKGTFSDLMKNFPANVVRDASLHLDLDLKDLLKKPIGVLSGGQRQTIALVMATLIPTKVLLLDEPTAALDPRSATNLLVFAAKFMKMNKVTTILITHDPNIAISLGNKLWVLENGVISKQFEGAKKKALEPKNLVGHVDYQRIATSVSG